MLLTRSLAPSLGRILNPRTHCSVTLNAREGRAFQADAAISQRGVNVLDGPAELDNQRLDGVAQ